jgi:mono/diheme cytochrome c family protein
MLSKIKNRFFNLIAFCGAIGLALVACRGDKSSEPPVALVQNMVDQTSFPPQSKNEFFKDGRADRMPVSHTVAQGQAKENTALYYGREPSSTPENPQWVTQFPVIVDEDLLKKGEERFNIYCAPCHGYAGNSDGLVTQRAGGVIRPAHIHDADKIALPVGKLYDVVSNGVNNWNMPGFAEQLTPEERWAVVAHVRALQISQQGKKESSAAAPNPIADKKMGTK